MSIITRDIYVTRQTLPNPIEYVQGTNALPIAFTFVDYTIPEGAAAKVYVEKPSRHCEYNLAAIFGNGVIIDVKDTMFDEVGTSNLQIKLTKDDKTLITFDYPVRVSKNRVAGNLPQSKDHSDLIDDLLARGGPAVEAAEAAADRANAAADRLEGTDVATLTEELDAHTGSQVNTDVGAHGFRTYEGKAEYFDGSKWQPLAVGTITNPHKLPDKATLAAISEPGIYYGATPSDLPAPSNLPPYTLIVFNCGALAGSGEQIARIAISPSTGAVYVHNIATSKWNKIS